ncbi:LexA family protein [Prosthecobacter vanneervenii]|uniref:Repressor LexA n=1 Tax=Prosthecobacter vanneervenii TaxID=48466 RepID=A0A7W7Y6I7_9BACT|nr:S24 family peptidase [Prosthecobacter vanneervenii]MBB5030533.1 repressor LexA [Prosthecobacter vanneervenii]
MLEILQNHPFDLLWLSQDRSWLRHQVPLLGSIIAGRPEFQEGRVDSCIDIDPTTLRLPKNARTFALKVRGDSMCRAAILEGDIVIMELREAKHGDIVAALIDGETTLKRFIVKGGVPYLRASNPNYPDLIPARELVIQGVLIALLRIPQK